MNLRSLRAGPSPRSRWMQRFARWHHNWTITFLLLAEINAACSGNKEEEGQILAMRLTYLDQRATRKAQHENTPS